MIVPIRWLWRVSAYGSPRSRSAIMGAGFWRSSPTEIDFIAPEYKGIVDCCLLCFWWARCDRQLRIVSDHVKKNSVPPPISELNVPSARSPDRRIVPCPAPRSNARCGSSGCNPEGLGPGLPINVNGLTADGPMAHLPLIDLTPRQAALNPPPMFPWMAPDPSAPMPGCTLICIGSHGPPVGAPPFPPTAPPPPFLPAAPPPPDPLAGPPGDAGLAPPAPAPAG